MDAPAGREDIAASIERIRADLLRVRTAIEALPYDATAYPTDCCADTLVRVAFDALLTARVNVARSWSAPITDADLAVAGDPRA